VNALSPGSIDTPGLADLLASAEAGEQRRKMIACIVPLSRIGTPEEITKAVVFLAYDDSSYITGTELFVDGGFAQVYVIKPEWHGIIPPRGARLTAESPSHYDWGKRRSYCFALPMRPLNSSFNIDLRSTILQTASTYASLSEPVPISSR
jgi:hypothetical protein